MSHQNPTPSDPPIIALPAGRIHVQFELERANVHGNFNNLGPQALPASKAAIDAMAKVEVTSEAGEECSICMEGLKVGCEAKKMPNCKHRFHSACIETWLLRHASCPLCRSAMPVQQEDEGTGWDSNYQADDRDSMELVFNIDVMDVQPIEYWYWVPM